MAFEVVMPRLGWNMEEGALAGWRKKDGDEVRAGEILFDVESDKAVQEVEALESGILRIPPESPPVGKPVPVGTLLAWLLAPGEAMPARGASPAAPERAPAPEPAPAQAPAAARPAPASQPSAVPGARAGRRAVSPRARRVAAELGVNWNGLKGSGRTGRIVERDVRAASSGVAGGRPPSARAAASTQVTMTAEADAAELVRLHDQFRAHEGIAAPSYTDFFIRMVGLALQKHPALNATAPGAGAVVPVHVAFSVDTDGGLVAPVVRNAESASLIAIARESSRLSDKARAGKLTADDTSGATFTVTDLGAFEIDTFTPLAVAPQAATLGVGRIAARPMVVDARAGTVAARHMVLLTLAYDPSRVDTGLAARFLKQVKHAVEQPLYWIAGVL